MKSPREVITALEEKATLEQIAFACKVKVRSVLNWRCQDEWKYNDGKNTVGEQSKELLIAFATSKGVEV